ncbi:MAG TPA: hypothetical protein VNS58_14350 [Puia sp.]|nr:hypothetical protein [Puia sp.]
MSNVKGSDIDDLFKRAADKYPLRTDSADWDRLAADLDKDRSLIIPPINMEGGDKKRRRRFFWLFLLLPLGGIGYYAWHAAGQKNSQAVSATRAANTQIPAAAGLATTPGKSGQPASVGGATPGTAGTATGKQASAASPASDGAVPATTTGETATSSNSTGRNRQRKTQTGEPGNTTYPPLAQSSGAGGLAGEQPTGSQLTRGQIMGRQTTAGQTTEGQITERQTTEGQITGRRTGMPAGERDLSLSALKSPRAQTTGAINLNVTMNASKSPVSARDSSGSKNNAKRKDNAKDKKQSFLYAGLIVAPDLSTIKMQSVKGAGTTFGLLLGYQFNRKWAVETGVYLDHKKYYTDGEYFKKNAYVNPNWDLLNVDGSCNMWEIPVNVRYNLSSGEKTKWFATAGLSTYLMTSEHYVSVYSYNGSTWPDAWGNKKPSQYWFSVINLSVGFEQKLGKIGNLRLEPYVRIPLSGMGSGSLPIMSAGLNIGITRRIWK